MQYINVSIPKSPIKTLTYSVPEGYPFIEEGMRVLIPIGPRFITGFVTKIDAPVPDFEVKQIADLVDVENLYSENMLQLTRWMAEYYIADWADLLKSALPPGMDVRPETLISITSAGETTREDSVILDSLRTKKTVPLKKLYDLYGHRGTFSQIRKLENAGYVEVIAGKKERKRGYNMVEVIHSADPPSNAKERALFDYLQSQPAAVWVEDLRAQFKNSAALLRKMAERGEVRRFWVPAGPKNLWPPIEPVLKLNKAQEEAYEKIKKKLNKFSVSLLHGVTGSGKTEIYLRLAEDVLAMRQSVLILVPEIALLPLIVHRTEQSLRRQISILHSELTERERKEEWLKAKRGDVKMVIGTRSAVFAPLQNLGLIIMDEEHDSAFKQKEYPRYHARESAIMRASFENCAIVLGSATPSVESFFNAGNGKYEYLSLPYRVEKRPMPEVRLVDMKIEYRTSGDPIFSRLLIDHIKDRLAKKEQILILQNRRGYASLLMCRECGNVLECPHCSVTMTYHKHANRMRCHYCGYSRLAPSKCEKCGSAFLHLFGVGTEKIVEGLRKLFPEAKIERFDRDTTRKRGSIARILTSFALKEIDILVGTQMLAKGHDFPNVTLVGVVGADSAIGIPDFRSSERLFQLLTQVAGRSGRGMEPGLVIVQTFHPDHYAIRCSIEQSYQSFYEKEIRFRRLMQYPPYVSLANIVFSGKEAKQTLELAREFAKLLLASKTENMKMLGPAIAALARIAGNYRFQILVKSPSRKELHNTIAATEELYAKRVEKKPDYSIDIDPDSII